MSSSIILRNKSKTSKKKSKTSASKGPSCTRDQVASELVPEVLIPPASEVEVSQPPDNEVANEG